MQATASRTSSAKMEFQHLTKCSRTNDRLPCVSSQSSQCRRRTKRLVRVYNHCHLQCRIRSLHLRRRCTILPRLGIWRSGASILTPLWVEAQVPVWKEPLTSGSRHGKLHTMSVHSGVCKRKHRHRFRRQSYHRYVVSYFAQGTADFQGHISRAVADPESKLQRSGFCGINLEV